MSRLCTTEEIAKLLEPSCKKIRAQKMVMLGEFPNARKIGRDWLVPFKDIALKNKLRRSSIRVRAYQKVRSREESQQTLDKLK